MSEALLPASTPSGGLHPAQPPAATSLVDFPQKATFHLWCKPRTGVTPVDGGTVHVSELIPGDGDVLLVCFASMATDEWEIIKREVDTGTQLGLRLLVVGNQNETHISSALYGASEACSRHGLTKEPKHSTVFTPSLVLMRLVGIDRGERVRNALILIRDGHVVAKWISGGDGDRPHDWTSILSMVS